MTPPAPRPKPTPTPKRHEPPREVALPPLSPFAGRLADGADYEALDLAGKDLSGASVVGASFLGCRFDRCTLDDVHLDRARVGECLLHELSASSLHARDSSWRDTLIADGRIGALLASGSTWDLVRIRGIRTNLVDLRGARLKDVVFEDCAIDELDLGDTELRAVRFEATTIDDLSVEGSRLVEVDLTGARLGVVRGIAGLRGATIEPAQLLDLAPQLAANIGITVRGEPPADPDGDR